MEREAHIVIAIAIVIVIVSIREIQKRHVCMYAGRIVSRRTHANNRLAPSKPPGNICSPSSKYRCDGSGCRTPREAGGRTSYPPCNQVKLVHIFGAEGPTDREENSRSQENMKIRKFQKGEKKKGRGGRWKKIGENGKRENKNGNINTGKQKRGNKKGKRRTGKQKREQETREKTQTKY